MGVFRVVVGGGQVRFAAAHMATFGAGCEPLHGHNYSVTVEAEGPLTPDAWVIDFGELRRAAREVVAPLDHRFLLQGASTVITMETGRGQWRIRIGSKGYTFPAADVAVLPIDNTTAERLAEWIARELCERLAGAVLARLAVGVQEMPGQEGWYILETEPPPAAGS